MAIPCPCCDKLVPGADEVRAMMGADGRLPAEVARSTGLGGKTGEALVAEAAMRYVRVLAVWTASGVEPETVAYRPDLTASRTSDP